MSSTPRTSITLSEGAPRLAAATSTLMDVAYPGKVNIVTRELVRILSGQLSHCSICRNMRLQVAIDRGFDESMLSQLDDLENSTLSDPQKAAIRLARAFLTDPKAFSAEDWDNVREHFSDEQVSELVLDLVRFRPGSKITVASGREPEADELILV